MNNYSTDASSSNEAVHLQQRLKSLSTELVTLRNRLHVGQISNNSTTLPSSKATGTNAEHNTLANNTSTLSRNSCNGATSSRAFANSSNQNSHNNSSQLSSAKPIFATKVRFITSTSF